MTSKQRNVQRKHRKAQVNLKQKRKDLLASQQEVRAQRRRAKRQQKQLAAAE